MCVCVGGGGFIVHQVLMNVIKHVLLCTTVFCCKMHVVYVQGLTCTFPPSNMSCISPSATCFFCIIFLSVTNIFSLRICLPAILEIETSILQSVYKNLLHNLLLAILIQDALLKVVHMPFKSVDHFCSLTVRDRRMLLNNLIVTDADTMNSNEVIWCKDPLSLIVVFSESHIQSSPYSKFLVTIASNFFTTNGYS